MPFDGNPNIIRARVGNLSKLCSADTSLKFKSITESAPSRHWCCQQVSQHRTGGHLPTLVPVHRSGIWAIDKPFPSRLSSAQRSPNWMIPRTPPPSMLKTTGRLVGGNWRIVWWNEFWQIGQLERSVWYSAFLLGDPTSTTHVSQIECLHGSMCSGDLHMQQRQVVVECRAPHLRWWSKSTWRRMTVDEFVGLNWRKASQKWASTPSQLESGSTSFWLSQAALQYFEYRVLKTISGWKSGQVRIFPSN